MKQLTKFLVLLLPAVAQAAVMLSWTPPSQKENGEPLELDELFGYELRYRCAGWAAFETIVIADPNVTSRNFDGLPIGECEFVMSAIDGEGLYSEAVTAGATITPEGSRPGPVTLEVEIPDRIRMLTEQCEVSLTCKLEGANGG